MSLYRRGYRRTLSAWLISEGKAEEPEDPHVDALVIREARLIQAREYLARNDQAKDRKVARKFGLKAKDIYGLRMDLDRTGELEVVDCGA